MIIEALDVDGAFVTTEGFGNNYIDFTIIIKIIYSLYLSDLIGQ